MEERNIGMYDREAFYTSFLKGTWLVFELMVRALLFIVRKHSPKFYTVDSGFELDNVKNLLKN